MLEFYVYVQSQHLAGLSDGELFSTFNEYLFITLASLSDKVHYFFFHSYISGCLVRNIKFAVKQLDIITEVKHFLMFFFLFPVCHLESFLVKISLFV